MINIDSFETARVLAQSSRVIFNIFKLLRALRPWRHGDTQLELGEETQNCIITSEQL